MQSDFHHDSVFGLGWAGEEAAVCQLGARAASPAADGGAGAEGARAAQVGDAGGAGRGSDPQAGPHSQRQQALLSLLQNKMHKMQCSVKPPLFIVFYKLL